LICCWEVFRSMKARFLFPAGRTSVSWCRLQRHCCCSYCCVSWPRNDDKRIRRRQTPLLLADIHTLTGWEEAMDTVSQILGMPNPASSFLFFVQVARNLIYVCGVPIANTSRNPAVWFLCICKEIVYLACGSAAPWKHVFFNRPFSGCVTAVSRTRARIMCASVKTEHACYGTTFP
jgi:hypothetical protein